MENTNITAQAFTPASYGNGLLRYIVPFYFEMPDQAEEAESAYDEICRDFDEKTDIKGKSEWNPISNYDVSPDLYDHVAQWLLPGDGGTDGIGKPEIGRSWHYAPFQKGSNQGLKTGWIKKDGSIMSTVISQLGVTVFVTGIGFLWFEARSLQENGPLTGDDLSELLEYSNELKELARDSKKMVDLSIPQMRIDDDRLQGMRVQRAPEGEEMRHALKASFFEGKSMLLDEEALISYARKNTKYLSQAQEATMRGSAYILLPTHAQDTSEGEKTWTIVASQVGFGKWVANLLGKICGWIRFFASVRRSDGAGKVQVPDKALMFGYVETDIEDAEALREATCRLAKGYTDRYHISRMVQESTIELFNDTCIYVGREGFGYIAGAKAADFYKDAFRQRIESVYFWAHMILLQQSYGILNYSRRVAKSLPANPEAYLCEGHNGYYTESMDRLLLEMNTFAVKNKYSAVSSIHHINDFYRYGYRQLSIDEEMDSLNEGLKALGEMQRNRRQLEEERREKERIQREKELQEEAERREKLKENKINTALGYLSLLAIISLLCDSIGLIAGIRGEIEMYNDGFNASLLAYSLGVLALFALVCIIGIRAVRLFRKH